MIKTSSHADKVCVAKVHEAGQEHVFEHWDRLSDDERKALLAQLQQFDFQQIKHRVQKLIHAGERTGDRVVQPPTLEVLPADDQREERELCRTLGEYALKNGEVAILTSAGSAGVGPLAEPVGLLPVGPVTGKSVFQLHAEKIRALNRRYRVSLSWYLFFHPNHQEATTAFFKEHGYFGLNCSDIHFLEQELLPIVDRRGKVLLCEPGRVATEPAGHGMLLDRLLEEDQLAAFRKAGVKYLFYFQADNPLTQIADPIFLGDHIKNRAQISAKCVIKEDPSERVGLFCQFDGALGIIENHELDPEDREARDEGGGLRFCAANIGNYVFSLEFLEGIAASGLSLPDHAVPITSPYVNKRGRLVRPTEPNAFKFQSYIFDALQEAERTRVVAVEREQEFSPIKNTGGRASPQTAQKDLSQLYARWLRSASLDESPEDLGRAVEISPLYAMDEDELREKIEEPVDLTSDVLL